MSNVAPVRAVDCNEKLPPEVRTYVQAGIAPATKRAFLADVNHFEAWGGIIPATDAVVAAYLADHAALLKASTLTRRLAAVSIAPDARDLPNPVHSPLVRATIRGIRREHGAAQRHARPLLWEDLFVVLAAMGDRPKDRPPVLGIRSHCSSDRCDVRHRTGVSSPPADTLSKLLPERRRKPTTQANNASKIPAFLRSDLCKAAGMLPRKPIRSKLAMNRPRN